MSIRTWRWLIGAAIVTIVLLLVASRAFLSDDTARLTIVIVPCDRATASRHVTECDYIDLRPSVTLCGPIRESGCEHRGVQRADTERMVSVRLPRGEYAVTVLVSRVRAVEANPPRISTSATFVRIRPASTWGDAGPPSGD